MCGWDCGEEPCCFCGRVFFSSGSSSYSGIITAKIRSGRVVYFAIVGGVVFVVGGVGAPGGGLCVGCFE